MSTTSATASDDAVVGSLTGMVGHIASRLAQPHYPNGDRAALRRWSSGQPLPMAYFRLWLHHLGQDPPPEAQSEDWMTIAWGLALAGDGAHQPGRPLGQALAEIGFAEARLERLLSAPDELRRDLSQSAVRFLAAKGQGCNFADLAAYLLTQDTDKRDTVNHRIARDYYRHLPRDAS